MDISRSLSEYWKVWIALAGMVLVLLWPRTSEKDGRAHKRGRLFVGGLMLLTLVASLNFMRWGPKAVFGSVNSYDLMHYYLGVKYFDELGYYDLYPSALLVDKEYGAYSKRKPLRHCRLQDEKGYRLESPMTCIKRGRVVRKTKFTERRWSGFERDFLYLQRDMKIGQSQWREMIADRGLNATPAWLFIAKPLANTLSVQHIKYLLYLDLILLGAALWSVRWAYGNTCALWALFFLGVTYSMRWPTPGTVFLRYDWLAALLASMALLKKGYPFFAGLLTGYAGLARLFPFVWLFGPAAKAAVQLFGGNGSERPAGAGFWKRLDRPALVMAGGVLAASLALEGGAIAQYGMETVSTHAENIQEHIKPEELSSRRAGFAIAVAYDGEAETKFITSDTKRRIAEVSGPRTLVAGLFLLILGFSASNLRRDEVFGLGFIPFFLLATASYYYYVARITLVVLHACDLSRWRNRVGLLCLLGLEVFANWTQTTYPGLRWRLIGPLSVGLTGYATIITAWLLWEKLRTPPGDSGSTSET